MRGRGYEAVKIAAEIAVPIAIVAVWELWARSADSQFWPPPSKCTTSRKVAESTTW